MFFTILFCNGKTQVESFLKCSFDDTFKDLLKQNNNLLYIKLDSNNLDSPRVH